MNLTLYDEGEKYSGKLVAEFKEDDTNTHYLRFDLNKKEDGEIPFIVGGSWVKIFSPKVMNLEMNINYKGLPVESYREIWTILEQNGWAE